MSASTPVVARAIVRPPGRRYAEARTRLDPAPPIDLDLARRQHAGYVEALRSVGVAVTELPPDDDRPDSVFVQDRVCVVDGLAILGPSAVASRCGEETALVEALRGRFPILLLSEPARLDWGDVLIGDEALFVGLSERTNRPAADQLREMLAPGRGVEAVPVPPGLLHFLSGCASLGERFLLAIDSLAEFGRSRGFSIIAVDEREPLAANALAIGRDVLVPAGYPRTQSRIEAAGFRTHAVSISEFEKRDGGVTCLSVFF